MEYRTTCLTETGADPELIEKSKVGIFEEDNNFKMYLYCLFKNYKAVSMKEE